MRTRILLMGITFCSLALASAAQVSFPALDDSDIEGVKFTSVTGFAETSLYGYIDGGAELYLEYGFDTLSVAEITVKDKDLKIEIYRMSDTEASFGIFSVSRFHCNGGARLTEYYCRSAYQLQVCKGPYYISIINNTGTPEEQELSDKIASVLMAQIDEPSFNPNLFYPSGVNDEIMKSAVLVRGHLGIFNGVPSLAELLEDAAGYTALVTRDESNTLASVRFDTEDGVVNYLNNKKIDREVLMKGEAAIISTGQMVSMICLQHLLITAE